MADTKHVVIIGGGFCGIMTAVHLMKDADIPIKITVINAGTLFAKGVAYNAYSSRHLLNVATGNMSAFLDDIEHFTNWVYAKEGYGQYEKHFLSETFLSRNLYGEYLCNIWETILSEKKDKVEIRIVNDYVNDLDIMGNSSVKIILAKSLPILANYRLP